MTTLKNLLTNFNNNLVNALQEGRNTSNHPTDKGDISELKWINMLKQYLPDRYKVEKGYVVDSNGNFSEQIDLIIFNKQYSPFIFTNKNILYIPAESVYAVFKIKQNLNKKHLEYAQKKFFSKKS